MEKTPGVLDRLFRLGEKATTVKTELAAGLTTFMVMAYIIFVNPSILSRDVASGAGVDWEDLLVR